MQAKNKVLSDSCLDPLSWDKNFYMESQYWADRSKDVKRMEGGLYFNCVIDFPTHVSTQNIFIW